MAELPIAPGQIYIEVEYDYEYKSKDRLIRIRQGDRYMLVKKTNEDWWQVKKEEGAKAFYVPAQYVREVRKALMPPPKPILHPPPASSNPPPQIGGALWVKPTNLEVGVRDRSPENLQRKDSNCRRSPSAQTASSGHLSPSSQRRNTNNHHTPSSPTDYDRSLPDILVQGGGHQLTHKSSTLPRTRARSPEISSRAPLDVDSTQHCDSAGEERRTNDSESGDELSSSSTEHLQTVSSSGQGHSDSPIYTNLQELKITQASLPPQPSGSPINVLGDWETYKDQNGRHFYYNRSTQERTWKPPRAKDSSTGNSRGESHSAGESCETTPLSLSPSFFPYLSLSIGRIQPLSSEDTCFSTYSSQSDSQYGSPARGWSEEMDEYGHTLYVSDYTNEKPSEKCGIVNMTKITENGKKLRKNWTSCWTVLQGSNLLFTKGQSAGTSWFGNQSKPEFTVDLKGGSADWASKDKSSKKNVIEVKTRQGTELLIQSESDSLISEWHRALQDVISTHAWESDEAIEEDMPESPGVEKHDKEKEHKDSKKGRAIKPSTSMDASDHKKTKHKLKKFLSGRPTLQSIRDKGYIKDLVFGCSLSSLCQRENSTVPAFVKMCIDHVENSGLRVDGLYRVSGNLAIIQKLRYAVNHDEKVNLADPKWEDIHVTTGALKMYFRELPEPLFTYALFHDFINAIKMLDLKQRAQGIKELVKQLPKPNHDTMQTLFKHLRKVIYHGEENRMTTQSVAIVFGPTLLRPEIETWNMAVHMVYQNQIVELILLEYESIFGR
ncbi:rho GTPase-activating protein 12-like isoform X11 [Channa argus]|uniref:rho GTPase-activating protein 12-like isoform X11 n=1 Tax=Channa argus TaxID=215402 RepID=UPI00351FACD2